MKHSSPLPTHPKLTFDYLVKVATPSWKSFRLERRDAYDELCAALEHRQRGLCVFCEIDLVTSANTKAREVEHWRPKSLDEPPDVTWTFGINNLQLGCFGGSRRHPEADEYHTGNPNPGPNISCGAIKGSRDPADGVAGILPYRPQDLPEAPCMFTVADDGALHPLSDCVAHGFDAGRLWSTIDFLGLNCTRLKNARRAIRQELDAALLNYIDAAVGSSDDERFDAAFTDLARDIAPPESGRLPRFVTTIRSFFGRGLDSVLFPVAGWSVATSMEAEDAFVEHRDASAEAADG